MIFTRPLIVLDTETTGLPKDPDAQPWEIAAVLYDVDGIEQGAFEAIGCPAVFREPMRRIIALGGIDPKIVLGSDPLAFGEAGVGEVGIYSRRGRILWMDWCRGIGGGHQYGGAHLA